MENEIWKAIPDFEGYYEASSYGQIRSVKRIIKSGKLNVCLKGRILKQRTMPSGYKMVGLFKLGVRYNDVVHRIIAKTFLDNSFAHREVNHKNGIKSDNNIQNLEWCNRSQNIRHSYDVLGAESYISKLTKPDVLAIFKKYSEFINELSSFYNVDSSVIKRVIKGRTYNNYNVPNVRALSIHSSYPDNEQ